jgi:uncharacterized membrane protein
MPDKPVTVQYQTLVVIWLALLASQVMFLVAIYFVKPELFTIDLSRPPLGEQPLVTLAFIASAIVFLILSFVLARQHMRRAVEDQDAGCLQTGLVLGCALSEVPSLLGVILAFVWDYQFFFVWIILGALGVLFHFPRKSSLDAVTYRLH